MTDKIDLEQYYTAKDAAEVLSRNSGKEIDPAYIRTLAKYGKFTPKKINNRLSLYPKSQVDAYVVEERGEKSGRAKQEKARTREE
ncbi:hypothetical protein KDA_18280 [Dictyobacter alpinus]|uniref:Uncharacterized protein n=1 Tax=Dictyobacter alpinus TaxID=2014873 RepID=A0A402B4R0_9CHLR|nr:hypothetical protein [Dictyobacter alpinus]GCE26344.1 hypothetical protein KDA_18280 [Dictyobacter alpinus]